MEVHHHAHTARKKWTHYFWEFLMLFLAVFCGFLAEYKLEHMIEHQREKKYSKQLLQDLRADSAFWVKRTEKMKMILEKHHHFYKLLTNRNKPGDKEILSASLPLLYTYDLQVTTATYNQMKASGNLRYIRNDELTAVLQQYYDVLLPRIATNTEMEVDYYNDIIYPFILKHFRVQDFDFIADTVKGAPVILNRTADSDQEWLNIMENYAGLHQVIQERLTKPAMKKLDELIGFLKEEYGLE